MPVVRISWFEGKDHEQKQKVAAEVTDSIVRNTGTDPQYIYVIFEDIKPSDWAGSGNLFGNRAEQVQLSIKRPLDEVERTTWKLNF